MSNELILTRPDDWHVHLRNNILTPQVVKETAQQFARVCAMPNLQPPITTVRAAKEYREQLVKLAPLNFNPYVSIYLTQNTPAKEIIETADTPEVLAFKLYPAGATTHSDAGIVDLKASYHLFATLEKHDVVLQIHGEVTDPEVDIFDREARFIDTELEPLSRQFPALRIVFEHITTHNAVQFIQAQQGFATTPRIVATITPQHLRYNRNALFVGGLRPHNYCLPVLKREIHRRSLITAATSGHPAFFLGSDSAPHLQHTKEASCGCAGCYTALHAMALYAEAFEDAGKLHQLNAFSSEFGARFYRLPINTGTLRLTKTNWTVPACLHAEQGNPQQSLVPLAANETLRWQIVKDSNNED